MKTDLERIKSIIESLIFVSEEPLPMAQIRKILEGVPNKDLNSAIQELMEEHAEKNRGFVLVEVAGGYQFRSRSENAEFIRMLIQQKPQKLSRAAMETLAIIAYRQPIIRPDVDSLRGTDSSGVIQTLLHHKLIKILGRQNAPGKPFIYGTTPSFLEKFGLKDLGALPTLKEIGEISGVDFENTPIDMLEEQTPDADQMPEDVLEQNQADPAFDDTEQAAPATDNEDQEPEQIESSETEDDSEDES